MVPVERIELPTFGLRSRSSSAGVHGLVFHFPFAFSLGLSTGSKSLALISSSLLRPLNLNNP